jgi:hypothetical protein
MKKCSTLSAIKEIQIKTTVRFHLTHPCQNSYQSRKQQQILVRIYREMGKGTLIYYWFVGGNVN